MVGDVLLWGTLGAFAVLAAGIGLCILLARAGALAVGFKGARYARGAVYAWIGLAAFGGGGTLGALHGAMDALEAVVDEPSFAASALRPAAAPLADGLVYAVCEQDGGDPRAIIAGRAPLASTSLRRVLTDPTGAAFFAGLRRVPALQASEAGRTGSAVIALLAGVAAKGKVEGALDTIGMREPLGELAAALPADAATIDRAVLVDRVEQVLVPRWIAAWLGRAEEHLLWTGLLYLVLALAAPVALLWLVEGIVRLTRSRPSP
jgi:hypothetical protein